MKMEKSEIERVLLSESQIAERVKEVAKKIDEDYQGKEVIAICILKGSVIFFADLIRAMKTPVNVEFMKVSSYGFGTTSSGKLSVSLDILSNIQGKDVLIVEDIIDSGNTMYALKEIIGFTYAMYGLNKIDKIYPYAMYALNTHQRFRLIAEQN